MAITDFFLTPYGMIMTGSVIALAVLIIYVIRRGGTPQTGGNKGPRKTVCVLKPDDHRYIPAEVELETAKTLKCKKREKIIRRFIKTAAGWADVEARRVMFLGIDGYAYLTQPSEPEEKHLSLKEVLQELFGFEQYEKMSEDKRDIVENTTWGLTVGVTIPEENDTLPFKSSEDDSEDDRQKMLAQLANPDEKTSITKSLMPILFGFMLGALIVLGIWKASG
jgi:hypothetical protein